MLRNNNNNNNNNNNRRSGSGNHGCLSVLGMVFIFLIVLCGIGWVTNSGTSVRDVANATVSVVGDKSQKAVANVCREDSRLAAELSEGLKEAKKTGNDNIGIRAVRSYAVRAHSIDLSDCPADFRESFTKYVEAMGQMVIRMELNTSLPGQLVAIGDFITGSTKNAEENEKVFKDLKSADTNLQTVAARYGVTVKH